MKPFSLEWWMIIFERYYSAMEDAQNVYDNYALYVKNQRKVRWVRQRIVDKYGE